MRSLPPTTPQRHWLSNATLPCMPCAWSIGRAASDRCSMATIWTQSTGPPGGLTSLLGCATACWGHRLLFDRRLARREAACPGATLPPTRPVRRRLPLQTPRPTRSRPGGRRRAGEEVHVRRDRDTHPGQHSRHPLPGGGGAGHRSTSFVSPVPTDSESRSTIGQSKDAGAEESSNRTPCVGLTTGTWLSSSSTTAANCGPTALTGSPV